MLKLPKLNGRRRPMMQAACPTDRPTRGLLAALVLVPLAAFAAHAQQITGVPGSGASDKPPYNIVFLIVDQRTYRLLAGADYSLPAIDSIARHGVTFQNHYISSAMCSPSRASFLTGQPPRSTASSIKWNTRSSRALVRTCPTWDPC